MSQILDYSRSSPPRLPKSVLGTVTTLAMLAVVYVILCAPAIQQRGYPPIDARLQGMTWIWIIGIPFTALFDPWSKPRMLVLILNALVTGYIDAASWPNMVPNHFNPIETLFETAIVVGPFHLIVTFVLEWLSRAAIRMTSMLIPVVRARTLCLGTLIFVSGFLIPLTYAQIDHWSLDRKGRRMADEAWASGRALLVVARSPETLVAPDTWSELYFDPATGLQYYDHSVHGWEQSYARRVSELLAASGKPKWAAPPFPPPADLLKYLDSDDFIEIKTIPYDVNPDITLFRSGIHAKWGSTASTAGPDLSIDTRQGGLIGTGVIGPVYVGKDTAYPGVIFIRAANKWLGAFAEDGRFLADVTRH